MCQTEALAVVPCHYDFFRNGVHRCEQILVRCASFVVQGISAFSHEQIGCLLAFLEIFLPVPESVVFTEGAFEQADTGLERKCGPAGDPVDILLLSQIVYSPVEIGDYVLHYKFTGIARLVEIFLVSGSDHVVIPRHIPEPSHFVEVEICAEESGDTIVMVACFRIFTHM